jgi:LmbE family N-acetylglucosaminyl deacetylase
VGVSDVRFLGYRDGELTVSHDLRRDITRVIRQVRPERVLTMSPERNWERIGASHPDHMAAAEATVQAIYPDARNPFAHPSLLADEGLQDWIVPELWMFGSPTPNTFVDVTDQLPAKMAALRAHDSQVAHLEDLEAMIREWMRAAAARGGLPEGRLAEMFHAVSTA